MTLNNAELVSTPQGLIFGTIEPQGIISRATDVANQLKAIVEHAKLYSMINKKKFVLAEGWTSMCAMIGVFPQTEYCRRVEREGEIVYEAKVLLRHISGTEVGSGESICSSREKNWSARDEYSIKSMAQTRAVGKACRLSFSWIMALAGYEAVPAEEVAAEAAIEMPRPRPGLEPGEALDAKTGEISQGRGPTAKAIAFYHFKVKDAKIPEDAAKRYMAMKFNKHSVSELQREEFTNVIQWLEDLAKASANAPHAQ